MSAPPVSDDAMPAAGRIAPGRIVTGDLRPGAVLTVYLRARGGAAAEVTALGPDGPAGRLETGRQDDFVPCRLTLDTAVTALAFDPDTTEVSVVHVHDPATVMAEGIRLISPGPAPTPPDLLAGYHFRPPFGWMNDPNGFGRFAGRAHLFYQHYPHRLRWHAMHWGHAVSDDLVRWRHLPVFLTPEAAVTVEAGGAGGAFSGSAMALPGSEGFRVFFTDHRKDRLPEQEIQQTLVTEDGLTAGPPAIAIAGRPAVEGIGIDNRDPYVFRGPDGRWKLLLGSRDRAGGLILLYETDDPAAAGGWRFVDVLHRERRHGMTVCECPCFVPLDGPAGDPATRWALIFGLLMSREAETQRRNLTLAIVGRFDGRRLVPDFEQEVDFITDAYGFQAFAEAGGAIGIAWMANWTDVSKQADFPSAMTLPRALELRDGALCTPPVAAVATLRQRRIDAGALAAGGRVDLGDGKAELLLTLDRPGAPFTLALEHPEIELALVQGGDGLELVYRERGAKPAPRYLARGAAARDIRVFVDRGAIEVFADDGRWTGAKRLPGTAGVTGARLVSGGGALTGADIWQLGL